MNATPMPIRFALALSVGLLALAGLACTANKDIGQTCKMTRPCDAGTCDIEADKVSNGAIDYVALGSAECDDLTCIRTSGSENPENESGSARGYCTAPCIDSSDCEPDFEGNKAMQCQQLLLDEAFLDNLRRNDPATFERMFGSGASSRYCVKPRQ